MSKELLETLETYKALEDERMHDFIYKHNNILREINKVDLPGCAPFQIAELEYKYSNCKLYAHLISSHYRKQQRYHESMAEQEYANEYERIRDDKESKRSAADAAVISRRAKGKQMQLAGNHEADYLRWNGIAISYESMINSLKDAIKAIAKEGG